MIAIINRILKRNSIFTILLSYILIFILMSTMLLFCISKYFITNFVVNVYLKDLIQTVCSDFEYTVSSTVTQINMTALNLTTWPDLYITLMNSGLTPPQKQEKLNSIMTEFWKSHHNISGFDIVTKSGATYRFSREPLSFDTPGESFTSQIDKSSTRFYTGVLYSDGNYYCGVGKKFINYYTEYDVGYLILYFREENIYSIYHDSILKKSSFFITSDDYIISHHDKKAIGSKLYIPYDVYSSDKFSFRQFDKNIIGKYLVKIPVFNSSINIYTIVSADDLYNIVNRINMYVGILLLVILLISTVIATQTTKKFLRQYLNLQKGISQLADDPASPVSLKTSNEFELLNKSFSQMASTINELLRQNAVANEKQRIAELRMLQAHINPHFIYNALDTISCMAKINKQPDIEMLTYALASYFRIGLSGGENLILLSEELRHVKSYVHVEQIRFPDLFSIDFVIPDELLNCLTVKIVLQPLVENTIRHGFKGMKKGGKIIVSATCDDTNVFFRVEDNGIGLKEIPDLSDNKKRYSGGYGLYNVQQRLEIEYGKGYGLSFESNPGGGTVVIIKIKKAFIRKEAFSEKGLGGHYE